MSRPGLAVLCSYRALHERGASNTAAPLGDERVRAIVRALADGPLQPADLERISGVARSTLYTRLGELAAMGVVVVSQIGGFPLRVCYELSDNGRVAVAGELLGERLQRRRLALPESEAGCDLTDLVRLLAPVSRVPRTAEGSCALVEREVDARNGGVWLLARAGRIAVRDRCGRSAAGAEGAPAAWDEVLVAGDCRRLELSGDPVLVRRVLRSLSTAARS